MSSILILITEHELYRFDLKGGRRPKIGNHWELNRVDTDDLATSVDKVLRQGPKRGANVYVLNSDWWFGTCSLGQDVLRQIDQEGIRQSLAIEAEAVSGLDAFESRVAYHPVNRTISGSDYLVLQVPEMDLLAIDDVVRQWGGKLKGLAHPSLSTVTSNSAGRRMCLEAWPDVTAVAQTMAGAETRNEVLPGGLHLGSVQEEVKQLIAAAVEESALPEGASGASAGTANEWLEVVPSGAARWFAELGLNGDEGVQIIQMEEWIRRWGEVINGRSRTEIPFVSPGKRPIGNQSRVALAALFGLLTIVGCFGHWLLSQRTLQTRQTTISGLESDIRRFGELQKQVTEIEREASLSQQELDSLSRDQAWATITRDVHLYRHAELLVALAELTPKEVLIDQIDGEADRVVVSGYSLDSQNCDRLTVKLAERVRAFGWRVHPCKVTLNEKQVYEFQIELTDDIDTVDAERTRAAIAERREQGSSSAEVNPDSIANSNTPPQLEGRQR